MPKYTATVMYERPDGTVGEDTIVVDARHIDEACEMAEAAVVSKGRFFYSDVRLEQDH